MADTTTSGEPVTAATLQSGDLIRISQDLGGGTFGNAKLAASALATWIAALPTAWANITGLPTTLSGYGITDAVPSTRTVNGHALSSNVTVTASDVGALPTGTTTAGVPDSTNKRYVTDAELAVLAVTSGTNTGDQTITLTGDVTGSGTGSFAATIAANAVTNAKAAQMAAGTIKGNNTGGTANAADLTATQATAMLNLFTSTLKGLVPLSGGGTTLFLRADGTWATPAGGGGSPGGSAQQIQYNNNGVFGGIQNSTFDGTNLILQASIGGFTILQGGASGGDIYTSPGNGGGNWYATNVKVADPQLTDALYNDNGVLTFSGTAGSFLASALMNQVNWWPIAGGSVPSMLGASATTSGFTWSSIVGTAATNAATRQGRARGSTAASAGATGVHAVNSVSAYTGVGLGMYAEFLTGVGTNLTGHQCFVGLTTNATSLAGDPSALTNFIGVGFDAADLSSGNWQFYTNDASGTATKIDTGIARGVAQLLWVKLYNLPNSVTWNVTVKDMVTGTVYSNQGLSTDTPASGSAMRLYQSIRTGATTTAAAIDSMRAFMKWISG